MNFNTVVLPVVASHEFGCSIENELLCSSSLVVSLKDNVTGSNHFDNSLHWHSRSDIEWSVDVEAKVLMKSLSLFLFCFVKIDNLPSLVGTVVSLPDDNWSSFFVLTSINVNTSVSLLEVAEVFISILE
jgi:hypothetical protein